MINWKESADRREPLSPTQTLVLEDFWLSFQYSQNAPMEFHPDIQSYVAWTYPSDVLEDIVQNTNWYADQILKFTLPKGHGKVDTTTTIITRQFLFPWIDETNIAKEVLAYRQGGYAPRFDRYGEPLPATILNRILDGAIERDTYYQYNSRPHRPPGKEHESFLRTHGLLRLPTGSDTYNQLFSELGKMLDDEKTRENPLPALQILKNKWEQNHDEDFFPQTE